MASHPDIFEDSQRRPSPSKAQRHSTESLQNGQNGHAKPFLPAKLKKGDKMVWKKCTMLGQGTSGSVYMALEEQSGAMIAVKEILFDIDAPDLAEKVADLEMELRILKELEHENVVGYYSCGQGDNSFYIFMEWVNGGSLQSLLSQFGPMTEGLTASFTKQLLAGLAHIHAKGMIHRDIKCANVLVTMEGTVKLADFGCSTMLDRGRKGMFGSPFWMAPEVVRGEKNVTPAADIWSLGCCILEMLQNEIPFAHIGNGFAVMSYVASGMSDDPVDLPSGFQTKYSPAAVEFIKLCLQRDPAKRPSALQLSQHPFIMDNVFLAKNPLEVADESVEVEEFDSSASFVAKRDFLKQTNLEFVRRRGTMITIPGGSFSLEQPVDTSTECPQEAALCDSPLIDVHIPLDHGEGVLCEAVLEAAQQRDGRTITIEIGEGIPISGSQTKTNTVKRIYYVGGVVIAIILVGAFVAIVFI